MRRLLYTCIILRMLWVLSGPDMCRASNAGDTLRIPVFRYSQPPRAEWRGDSLRVSFSGGLSGRLKGPEALHLIPLYISGKDTVRYPELGCFTASGAGFNRRRETFSENGTARRTLVLRRGTTDYRESMPVPSSMKGELLLLHLLTDCCDSHLLSRETVAVPARPGAAVHTDTSGALPLPVAAVSLPLFETNVTFVCPQAEAVKERTATATVRITYPVNRWQVYPHFGNNEAELRRVDSLLSPVATDTATYRVLSVSIIGYASPEDTYSHNMTLSEKRAGAMRDYLRSRYRLATARLTSEGRGEDWEGLRRAVESSGMEAGDRVLHIIDTYGIFNGREKRLMDLQGGKPYRYMLENLYPPLRRMEMKIFYRVRAFRADEAAQLLGSRPQDLSHREMYEAARAGNSDLTIIKRRDDYGREYDIAVRYFPDDDIANINASSAALVRGDLEQAWFFLGKVKSNPLARNNLGVYHWICGRTEEAKAYFEKAKATDPARAAYNLEQLRRWEEEFAGKDNSE